MIFVYFYETRERRVTRVVIYLGIHHSVKNFNEQIKLCLIISEGIGQVEKKEIIKNCEFDFKIYSLATKLQLFSYSPSNVFEVSKILEVNTVIIYDPPSFTFPKIIPPLINSKKTTMEKCVKKINQQIEIIYV